MMFDLKKAFMMHNSHKILYLVIRDFAFNILYHNLNKNYNLGSNQKQNIKNYFDFNINDKIFRLIKKKLWVILTISIANY